MDSTDDILWLLLVVSVGLGIVLGFVSTAAAGRTVADLERQAERDISGAPRIQAWVNFRTHLNRTAFATVFVVINVMLLSGAPESWRMWVNRTLWTVLLASFVVMAVMDWLAERKQVSISLREMAAARAVREALADEATERRGDDLDANHESYRQIAAEAVSNLEVATNQMLVASGQPALVFVAPVVPEHNSPTTPQQQEVAVAATLRARLVAATLALGLPPRKGEGPG